MTRTLNLPRPLPYGAGLIRTAVGMTRDPYYRTCPRRLLAVLILQQRSLLDYAAHATCPHPAHTRAAARWTWLLDRVIRRIR